MSAPNPEHLDAVAGCIVDPGAWASEVHLARQDARRLLDSTDPAVHAALLDALTRHGVLTEEKYPGGNPAFMGKRRLVTPWEVAR